MYIQYIFLRKYYKLSWPITNMYALVYSSSDTDEDSPPQKRPFTVCPKCGRFIRIDGHCECEAIFFGKLINIENSKSK
jgi:hypothetical protein